MNPSHLTNPEPCSHLAEYKRSHGTLGFRSVQALIRAPAIAGGGAGGPLLRRRRRLLCLECSGESCGDHAIAVDVDRAELFCGGCGDQVYDRDFDGAVVAARIAAPPRGALPERRRRRRRGRRGGPMPRVSEEGVLLVGREGAKGGPMWGLRGLNNLGSTCFMNSVLQALLHTPPLRNYFLSARHAAESCRKKRRRSGRRRAAEGGGDGGGGGGGGTAAAAAAGEPSCLCCEVGGVFAEVFSGDPAPYSPARFLYSWWQHSSNLAGYEQQDAHEFFISVLDRIHEMDQSYFLNKGGRDCHCIAHRVFSGVLQSDVTCTNCGFTSTTYDPCVDLSLDLEQSNKASNSPRISTLVGCLDLFTRPEKLGPDQKLFCQQCQVRRDSVKQMSIRQLPLVLCFHIKRFEHSLSRRMSRKIDEYLQFPFSLDMTPYLSSSIIRGRFGNRIFTFEEDEYDLPSELSSEYEVFAVVAHSGRLESGHYVAYLRFGEEWYKCDDAWITRVTEAVVRASQGYMIYYVQKERK